MSNGSGNEVTGGKLDQKTAVEGIHTIYPDGNGEVTDQLIRSLAVAISTSIEIKPGRDEQDKIQGDNVPYAISERDYRGSIVSTGTERTGVFLCSCGGSITSVIDFKAVARKLLEFPGINYVHEINQACTEEGATQIANLITEWQLGRMVLAACRCCNLDQVCYSCTDRRIMCQQYVSQHCVLPNNKIPEFVNIREQCAWVHKDDHRGATRKAVQMVLAGVARTMTVPRITPEKTCILPGCLVIGGGFACTAAAGALVSKGYQVQLLSRQGTALDNQEAGETSTVTNKQLQGKGVIVKSWPTALKLTGSPGNYEAVLEYSSGEERVTTGAVLLDMEELNKGVSPIVGKAGGSGLLGRIISRNDSSSFFDVLSGNLLREITINETAGIFMLSPDGGKAPNDQVLLGMAAAARVATYLEQKSISPRTIAVSIDSKLCRGCGTCANICPYIELIEHDNGAIHAYIDKALCIGCGACVTSCPTGAIKQPFQSNKQINATLRALLHPGRALSEV
jgi:heterodisulfide reductase subunit A